MDQSEDRQTRDALYRLADPIRHGDRKALLKLCDYTDSTKEFIDNLGYHLIPATAASTAVRIIKENTFLLKAEIDLDSPLSGAALRKKLTSFGERLVFEPAIGAFMITPLKTRRVAYSIKTLPASDAGRLKSISDSILHCSWTNEQGFPELLKRHDPKALYVAAQIMLKHRNRWNEYDFDDVSYTDVISFLTGSLIGVPGNDSIITYNISSTYGSEAKLNYAVYWANHFRDYRWNPTKAIFENLVDRSTPVSEVYNWFLQLNDTNDVVASSAFVRLTEIDTDTLDLYSRDFNADHYNYTLPTFWKRFLDQLVIFTGYCRENHIDYKGSSELQRSLAVLRQDHLPYAIRYAKENELVERLTLNDISAVEYWGLVYENTWASTFSIGRTLDKFYSKHWVQIVSDSAQLSIYLKKTYLFRHLGIIGSCNHYAAKFTGYGPKVKALLEEIARTTGDSQIKAEARDILDKAYWTKIKKEKELDVQKIAENRAYGSGRWPDNMRVQPFIVNYQDSLSGILAMDSPLNAKKSLTLRVTELARYNQLGQAIAAVQLFEDEDFYYTNGLIKDQFGITSDYIRSRQGLDSFLRNYERLDELSLYCQYLNSAGIDIWKGKGQLDYEKVYDLLKYDLVVPFVGGGNKNRSIGIFAVVKMLEAQFKTKLGLPDKDAHRYDFMFSSYSDDRRNKWISYLKQQKLIAPVDIDPPSFFDFD